MALQELSLRTNAVVLRMWLYFQNNTSEMFLSLVVAFVGSMVCDVLNLTGSSGLICGMCRF